MKRRVVITGMGGLSPIGNTVPEMWENAKNGVCGIDTIKSFDTENHKVKVAGELKNYNPEDYMDKMQARRTARFTQFALIAAREAMAHSGISMESADCRLLKKNITKASREVLTEFHRSSCLWQLPIWRQAW